MKWLIRLFLLVVVLGLLVYFGLPMLLGTGWAKERIRESMEKETGRKVDIGSVSFSWSDGLAVRDVRMAQKEGQLSSEGPLFVLDSLNFDLSFGDLLGKKIKVDRFDVVGPEIVIVRDKDGRLNIQDLLERGGGGAKGEAPTGKTPGEKPPKEKKPTGEAPTVDGSAPPDVSVDLDLRNGRLVYLDQGLDVRIEAEGIDADVGFREGKLDIEMTSTVNGGPVKLVATLDPTSGEPEFEVKTFDISGASVDRNFTPLAGVLPLLGDNPNSLTGTLGFHLKDVKGRGVDRKSLANSLSGGGSVRIEGGALASGPVGQLIGALSGGGGESKEIGFELFGSTFRFDGGRIATDDLKLSGAGIELRLSGYTQLNGKIHYTISADKLDELIARNPALQKYVGKSVPLSLTGRISDPKIDLDLQGAAESALRDEVEKRVGGDLEGSIRDGIGNLLGGDDGEDEKADDGKKKGGNKKKKKNGKKDKDPGGEDE